MLENSMYQHGVTPFTCAKFIVCELVLDKAAVRERETEIVTEAGTAAAFLPTAQRSLTNT